MADFRKWFVVLAVLALAAATASAQVIPFGCTASNGGQVPVIRSGGLTELVGEVTLTCAGGVAGVNDPITANFQIFMNTTVSNQISSATDPMLTQSGLAVVDTGGNIIQLVQGALQHNNVPIGGVTDAPPSRNSISYNGVQLPQGSNFTLRIVNVRVVAPPVVNAFIPAAVTELVTATTVSGAAVPIANPSPQVAAVVPALRFDVTDCLGGTASGINFNTCSSTQLPQTFGVKFTELTPLAFKNLAQEQGLILSGPDLVNGGTVTIDDPSTVTNGTRLIVTFGNVPAGVTISVSISPTEASAMADAVLVSTAADGSGGSAASPLAATGLGQCGQDDEIPVRTLSSSNAAAWEILTDNAVDFDHLTFLVQVSFAGASASTTGANIAGSFAPTSTDNFARTGGSIVRFSPGSSTGGVTINVAPCVTNLLFPYLTTTSGYDSGIALVNTSLDNATGDPAAPFNTPTQEGICTMYFFGLQNGDVSAIPPIETPSIPAGQLFKFAMANNPPADADLTNFDGYMIARCEFQYGHGFAFIVDTNPGGFGAQAYLALVIPDLTGKGLPLQRNPDPFSVAAAGTGEQLTN
jgi:hypothetical protein